ncbi:hypothetical protein EV714DRAFT_275261 [Schizophyllum commune]
MATTTDSTPAAGQAKSKSQMRVINDYKEIKESPGHATAKYRIKNIRQRLDNLIGLKVCAITNMVTAPWAMQAIHIVTRALKKEDEIAHECFRKAVGVLDKDGVPQVNLDNLGNVDFEIPGVHIAFDGPPFASNDIGYGKGDMALLPLHAREELQHIKRCRGMDYKKARHDIVAHNVCSCVLQMYPMKKGTHEYVVYGFPNPHQHTIPRYSHKQRTYPHSLNRDDFIVPDDPPMPAEVDGYEGAYNDDGGDYDDDDDAPPENTLRGQMYRDYMQAQTEFGKVQHEVLETGINIKITFVSHLNPVFVFFDFAYKMRYRIKHGKTKGIPPEDLRFFHKEVWPVVLHWFEPVTGSETETEVNAVEGPEKPNLVVLQSAPEVASGPAVPARARLAKTAPVYNCDTSSPLTDFESSPSGPDTSTATGLHMTKRILRPLKKPDFQNTAHSSSDAGPNSPPPEDMEGPVEDAAFSTTQSASAEGQDSDLVADSAKTDKKVVRFATVAEHDTGEPEEHSDDNVEQPAQTATSASSTTAESSVATETSEAEPPSVDPPAPRPPPRRRTARTTAGRPPKPPAPLTQATSKQTVPKNSRSGNVAAAAESSTALAASSSSAQATSSSSDSGPSQRPSRAKKTGDKRSRDDDGESEDDDDDDEPDGSEFLPARRARKKVRAQGSNKPPARASSKGASKKGGKSGK